MGEVFGGRYELIDLLGEGGMGAVWRARDLKLNRIVAAKVLRQSDASALLRFVREQGLRVNHPNVIAPLGWIGEDNQVLFTMRIVAGGSLATLIGDHGALPPRFAAEILRQLLAGLQAVHAAHLVHRDVKPANILLDATPTPISPISGSPSISPGHASPRPAWFTALPATWPLSYRISGM